jgi:L-ascorbate metabolism protein UlaG (beta-lactamase superfamily)
MYGGPFMSLDPRQVTEVERLIATIRAKAGPLLELAVGLQEFDEQLQGEACGYSISDFYSRLPPILRGLIECLYDPHHRPTVRLLEPLIAREFDLGQSQEIMLAIEGERNRHFFMSTPRVDAPGRQFLQIRFNDPRIDALARMRTNPESFSDIVDLLKVPPQKQEQFRSFFTTSMPTVRSQRACTAEAVCVRYFGHACVLVESAGVSVLFDPMFAFELKDDQRLTFADLPECIDYVVLSHAHQDHFSPEMLLQIRHRAGCVIIPSNNSGSIADPSMRLALRELGFDSVIQLEPLDTLTLPDGELQALPFTGEHGDLNIYSKSAYALRLKGRQLLFLVDSDGRDPVLYERLMRYIGPVDTLFIGMECHGAPLSWLYEPVLGHALSRRNNESRRLSGSDSGRAISIIEQVQPREVCVYAMGQEPWLNYLMGLEYTPDAIQLAESDKLVEHCRANGIEAQRLYCSRDWTI